MQKHPSITNTVKGFSIIEILFVTFIVIIIANFAIPSISKSIHNAEAKRVRTILHSTIKIAKSTSYIYHRQVFMCLTDINNTCHKNAQEDIILFFDNNKNSKYDKNIDYLIKSSKLNLRYSHIHLRAGRRHYVRFSGDSGTPRGFFGHFKYCPKSFNNENKYQLSFNQVGIVRFKPNSTHPTNC